MNIDFYLSHIYTQKQSAQDGDLYTLCLYLVIMFYLFRQTSHMAKPLYFFIYLYSCCCVI